MSNRLKAIKLSKTISFNKNTYIDKFSNLPVEGWPEAWKKQYYKVHQRLENMQLDLRDYKKTPLTKIILQRRSSREFKGESISSKLVTNLLVACCGINRVEGESAYRGYPSAGARYPIETYIVIKNNPDIEDGLYHYNVKQNSITCLLKGDLSKDICSATEAWLKDANIIIILTCVIDRSYIKYGDRSYRFALIEAGHIAQNIYLYTTEQKLKCCGIGGFIDNKIHELLDIDDEKEFAVYILAIGK